MKRRVKGFRPRRGGVTSSPSIVWLAVAILALVGAACGESGEPGPTAVPATAPPAATTEPATTTPAPPSPPDPALTTRELVERVSPSLAFIETSLGSGSGVLVDGGWIVTNAHVVWPFDSVRVVFPDGTEYLDSPVVRADVYQDLAVIGPIGGTVPQLILPDALDFGVGDTVYLMGYPGEVEEFPEPAITQGVISRTREWELPGITFIQTDALIAGGQSGGALLSETGEVLGISGLGGFTEGNFALVAAAADIRQRVQDLIDGVTPDRFTIATMPLLGAALQHDVELASYWHDAVYVLEAPIGSEVDLFVVGDDHVVFATDALGFEVAEVEELSNEFHFTVESDEPHYVFVNSAVAGPTTTTLVSSHAVAPWTDVDDDLQLAVGMVVEAAIDISNEYDVFRLELEARQQVTIAVDGLFDPALYVDRIGNPGEPLAFDSDSGGGLYGTNAELTFTAVQAGEYLVVVSDELQEPGSGYVLSVSEG